MGPCCEQTHAPFEVGLSLDQGQGVYSGWSGVDGSSHLRLCHTCIIDVMSPRCGVAMTSKSHVFPTTAIGFLIHSYCLAAHDIRNQITADISDTHLTSFGHGSVSISDAKSSHKTFIIELENLQPFQLQPHPYPHSFTTQRHFELCFNSG